MKLPPPSPYRLRELPRGPHAFCVYAPDSGGWEQPVAYITHCSTPEETKSFAEQFASAPQLEWERDALEHDLKLARDEVDEKQHELDEELDAWLGEREQLRRERDEAWGEAEACEARAWGRRTLTEVGRDAALARITELEKERDTLKAKLASLEGLQ